MTAIEYENVEIVSPLLSYDNIDANALIIIFNIFDDI